VHASPRFRYIWYVCVEQNDVDDLKYVRRIRAGRLRMDVLLGGAAAMPSRKEDAAAAALVLDVLHGAHHVGDAAQAGEAAEREGPCAAMRQPRPSSATSGG
jgi:hypothetical protein